MAAPMLLKTARLALFWLSLCVLLPRVSHAQQDAAAAPTPEMQQARVAFSEGQQAYNEGRFEEALGHFERAYELTQHAEILYNIATVADRLRKDKQALDAYEAYLAQRPDAKDREHVEGRIRVLREAEAQRQAAKQKEQERLSQSIAHDEGPGVWPWVVVGSGAALAIGGGVLLLLAQGDISTVEDAEAGSAWSEVEDANDRAPTLSTAGAIMLGVGAAAAVVGISWALLSADSSEQEPEAELRIAGGPNSAGLNLIGRF